MQVLTCCSTLPPQEYADGADLFTVLQRYGGRLSERVAVQMVLDPFIRVLDYLHSRGIIHRDIKVRAEQTPEARHLGTCPGLRVVLTAPLTRCCS